jgi:hypothetical protein
VIPQAAPSAASLDLSPFAEGENGCCPVPKREQAAARRLVPTRGQPKLARDRIISKQLLLARIVSRIDVINTSRTDELDLENTLLITRPGVVSVLSWIHPERARL